MYYNVSVADRVALRIFNAAAECGDGAFGSCRTGQRNHVDVVLPCAARLVGCRVEGVFPIRRDFISPIVLGRVDILSETHRRAPLRPGIVAQADGFEDVHFSQASVTIRAEIKRFTVGVQEGRALGIGSVDRWTKIDRSLPIAAAAHGNENIGIAVQSAMERSVFRNPISRDPFPVRRKQHTETVRCHKGIGVVKFAVHHQREVHDV